MPNYKKTEELTLKLIKGHPQHKYYRPADVLSEERFYHLVCRQTRDAKGNNIPLLDKEGNPIYYQLQYFLDSDTDTLSEEQKQMLLLNPRYRDPTTGEIKKFPYKELRGVIRVLTEVDGKEWLKVKWMWEGLRKDKGIETKAFDIGTYDHPLPTNELRQINPNDRDSPLESKITAINYKQVYEIPFTKESYEKVLAERSAPREEKHINMKLLKIGHSGQRSPFALEVTNQDQFLNRPFMELWDYLASAPARKTEETKIGKEKDKDRNKQYS